MKRAMRTVCASCTRKLLLKQQQRAAHSLRNKSIVSPLLVARNRPYSSSSSSINTAQEPDPSLKITEETQGTTSDEEFLRQAHQAMHIALTNSAIYELDGERTLKRVLSIAQRLRDRNIPFNVETYEMLQSAYAKRGLLSEMVPLLQEMAANDIEPSMRIFHNALQLAAWMSNPTEQGRILAEMDWWGAEKTRTTYENLLRCTRNNGELERMLEIFKEMEKNELKPTLESYDEGIDLALHYHEPEVALEILTKAMTLREFRTRHRSLMLKVLRGAAMESCHPVAKKVWQMAIEERRFDPDEGLCTLVLHVAGRYADPELGNKVIIKIKEMGFPWRPVYFPPLIQAYAAKSDWKSSFKLLHIMRKVGITPSKETAAPIAKALGRDIPAIRKALLTLHDLAKVDELDVVAVNVVIHSFAYNGLYEQCMSTYYLAPSWGIDINIETVDALLDACIHEKQVENGISIYERHIQDGLEPTASTLSKMMVLICTQDDYEEAFKYLELMKANGLKPLRGAYYRLVKKLAKANDPRLPWVLEEMKSCEYETPAHVQAYIEQHTAVEEKEDAENNNM